MERSMRRLNAVAYSFGKSPAISVFAIFLLPDDALLVCGDSVKINHRAFECS